MDRVIFCPDESFMESAVVLSRLWSLPIQVGHSGRTKELYFDDDNVSVLSIPTDSYVEYSSPVNVHQLFSFSFIDDFDSCKDITITLSEIDNDGYVVRIIGNMSLNIQEEHRVVVKHRFTVSGKYLIRVMRDAHELCKNEVLVTKR